MARQAIMLKIKITQHKMKETIYVSIQIKKNSTTQLLVLLTMSNRDVHLFWAVSDVPSPTKARDGRRHKRLALTLLLDWDDYGQVRWEPSRAGASGWRDRRRRRAACRPGSPLQTIAHTASMSLNTRGHEPRHKCLQLTEVKSSSCRS